MRRNEDSRDWRERQCGNGNFYGNGEILLEGVILDDGKGLNDKEWTSSYLGWDIVVFERIKRKNEKWLKIERL